MDIGKKGKAMDGIKGTFDLYGLGDGDMLFDDYKPASASVNAFTAAADPSARTGEYWKPEAPVIDAAVIDNFRDMVFGLDKK